jgi:serine/threonine protein kinase/Tfp pilus assembly protein PilF
MEPERWLEVQRLYDNYLESAPQEREHFLTQACAGDQELHREVQSLLACRQEAEKFFAAGAFDWLAEKPNLPIDAPMPTAHDFSSHDPSVFEENVVGVLLEGRYSVEKELARGGIAVTYFARDLKLLSKPVVIKVLQNSSEGNQWLQTKFTQEKEALTRIDHPGVIGLLDAGQTPTGKPFLVIQFVDGVTLRSVLQPNGMDLERVGHLVRQMCQALDAAHDNGIWHRDLKPENIMLQKAGVPTEFVKVIDFGLARVIDSRLTTLDSTGHVAGSISYMAPEQLQGRSTSRSDIYALGVIAYEMVTGRRPFNPESQFQLLEMQHEGVKVKPKDLRPSLTEAAQGVILKAMSFEVAERYGRPGEFGDAFVAALTDEADPKKIKTSTNARSPSTSWLILSALSFALSVGAATLISHRFLSGGIDGISVGGAALLTLILLSTGSTFTEGGWQSLQAILLRRGVNLKSKNSWRLLFALVSMLVVLGIYFSLPAVARRYNSTAIQFQQAGDLPAAIRGYQRASSLDPDYAAARYNLATAFEDVVEFDKAIDEYQKALVADPKFYAAHNNLARLYLVQRKDYATALNILNMALALKSSDPHVRYSLYKNRGWAHFALGLYDLAEEDLRESLHSRSDGAAAHCLLAQVLEAKHVRDSAMTEWERCVAYAGGNEDLESIWLSLAQERLRQGEMK